MTAAAADPDPRGSAGLGCSLETRGRTPLDQLAVLADTLVIA